MTAHEKIIKYLRGRKTGATVPEIVQATGLNANTVRGRLPWYYEDRRNCKWVVVHAKQKRKCRVTGKMLSAYGVQS